MVAELAEEEVGVLIVILNQVPKMKEPIPFENLGLTHVVVFTNQHQNFEDFFEQLSRLLSMFKVFIGVVRNR